MLAGASLTRDRERSEYGRRNLLCSVLGVWKEQGRVFIAELCVHVYGTIIAVLLTVQTHVLAIRYHLSITAFVQAGR